MFHKQNFSKFWVNSEHIFNSNTFLLANIKIFKFVLQRISSVFDTAYIVVNSAQRNRLVILFRSLNSKALHFNLGRKFQNHRRRLLLHLFFLIKINIKKKHYHFYYMYVNIYMMLSTLNYNTTTSRLYFSFAVAVALII